MSNRFFRTLIFLTLFTFAIFFRAPAAFASTGFLGGPMWISPEVPQDGQFVNLSALFHNAEPNELSGTVSFYDGDVLLGSKTVKIDSGGVGTATVSLRIGAGDHSFSASIGDLNETLPDGTTQPFELSPQSVELPTISVSPKAGNALNASVVSGTTNLVTNNIFPSNPIAPIAKQVDQLEGNVISSIPSSVASPVVTTAANVDSWRTQNADSFANQTKAASISVNKDNELAASEQKKYGSVSASTDLLDRPFDYVKLFFFSLLSFIWSHSIVFYGIIVLIIYAVLRFLYKKISGRRQSNGSYQKNSKFQS